MEKCPTRSLHTEGPDGYSAWHDWAEEMDKTHRQELCPGCRLYAIWTPRETAPSGREHK
jgi:hypothetical protein